MRGIISELKRRNVFRVAVAYLALAWLITEVADTLFPAFGVPDWGFRFVVILLALGFVPALVFSWIYELTPEGLVREEEVDRQASITQTTGRRLDTITIIVVLLAAGLLLADRIWMSPPAEAPTNANEPDSGSDGSGGNGVSEHSVAVLPFTNMSSDEEQEYFADGLSDTLIHVLAQVSGLKVTAKTSSFYFKGKDVTIAEIADRLQVAHVLEGSVQRSGNQIRVIAQLINASDGSHVWSRNFDRSLEDIFALQDEIAREVVEALRVSLLDTEQERLSQRYEPTLEAYGEFILGRQQMALRTEQSLIAAERHFQRATELDPNYALAYVGLADVYNLQQDYGDLVASESLALREPLIDKALSLDPLSGEGFTSLAYAQFDRNQYDAADESYRRAIELTPSYAQAHQWYSILLRNQGRFEDALAHARTAVELDPMAPIIQVTLASAAWQLGRVEEALAVLSESVEENPDFTVNYTWMSAFQAGLGHVGKAQRWNREALKRNPESARYMQQACYGYLMLDDASSAQRCAEELLQLHPEKNNTLFTWVALHSYRGDWAAAIAILEPVVVQFPGRRFATWLLADLVARQGDMTRARQLMADTFPAFLEEDVELSATGLSRAMVMAAILNATGETEQRDVLLSAMESRIATMHRTRDFGFNTTDVYVHALRGERDLAIASLREAIDDNWRASYIWRWVHQGFWWSMRDDWKLNGLQDDPEFIALMEELAADIAIQRRWWEENKDNPLSEIGL